MKFYSVDRFEEEYAILVDDDCASITVLKRELPKGIKAGNVLQFENGKYIVAPEEEEKRRNRIRSLQNKLFKK